MKSFNVKTLVEKTAQNFKEKLSEKLIESAIEIDESLPKTMKGDPQLLGLILRNLYSNAVKFTETGTITLRVAPVTHLTENKLVVRFEVEDTGIGIREQYRDLLFGSFTQLDTSSTKTYQGTGLGLAISKKIADLLKGEIGVDSEWQKGSKFWFTIPLIVEDSEATDSFYNRQKILELLNEYRVLLVEDNLINQKITRMTLEKEGCQVDLANNGVEGFEKYQQQLYDLVLMDIQMPVMDGLEATKRIREFEASKNDRHAFIIALSANALKDDREKAMTSGMDGFLAKPFKPDELFQLLFNLIIRK
jgi:CheY-like chemotaxis protein